MSYVSLQDRLTKYVQSRGWAFGAMERRTKQSVRVAFGRKNDYFFVDAEAAPNWQANCYCDNLDDAVYDAAVKKLDERMPQLEDEGNVSKEPEVPPPPLDMSRLLIGLVADGLWSTTPETPQTKKRSALREAGIRSETLLALHEERELAHRCATEYATTAAGEEHERRDNKALEVCDLLAHDLAWVLKEK